MRWRTEVEGRSPAEVGPLLGLAPNAVAALAYRAREGLRQAYLNAHIQARPPAGCEDIVPKLGAYVRHDLSNRDRQKVEAHLEGCERCQAFVAGGPGRGGDGTTTGGCPDAPEVAPAGGGESMGTSVPLGDCVAASEPGVTALGAVPAPSPPAPEPAPLELEPSEPADDPPPASLTVCC